MHMDSEKLITSFEIKKDGSPDYLWEIFYFLLLFIICAIIIVA